jgi:glycosyltransferase involved in cell wall biosynthesis
MRLHVPSLPWTETTADYLSCAYTQKVVKFAQMMESLGHEVVLYSGEENEAPCAEHWPVVSQAERKEWFGEYDPVAVSVISGITWDPMAPPWATMNQRVVEIIQDGLKTRDYDKTDMLCLISGWCQEPIARALPAMTVAEWGVGYQGVVPRDRWGWCFESYAWMHYVYGRQAVVNGRWYDTTIPNSFDPDDFDFEAERGDYLLFLGRVIERKGAHVGAQIAERLGMRYIVAGPGARQNGKMVVGEIPFPGEYVGPADKELRAELLSGAAAVMMPTIYLEPFGGVAVEAMMSGTPVVATNWGAFTETVVPGISGEFFRTLPEGLDAVRRAFELDRHVVRKHAERYSIWNVRHEYDKWLRRLDGLWADGRGVGDWNGAGAA